MPYAMDMLRTADSAVFLMQQMGQERAISPIATVSTSAPVLIRLPGCLLPAVSGHCRRQLPSTTGGEQVMAMREEKHDVHFAYSAMLPDNGGWIISSHITDKLVLVVPKGHRLTKKPLDFADLTANAS
jgi:DNA-binding transcriptional LysR family regulator